VLVLAVLGAAGVSSAALADPGWITIINSGHAATIDEHANAGNYRIWGLGYAKLIRGGKGDNELVGDGHCPSGTTDTDYCDTSPIPGSGAGHEIDGGGGDNAIYSGYGPNEILRGGQGHNYIQSAPTSSTIYGGPTGDAINATQGTTTVYPGKGTNAVDARSPQVDTVICTGKNDYVLAYRHDVVKGCAHVAYYGPARDRARARRHRATHHRHARRAHSTARRARRSRRRAHAANASAVRASLPPGAIHHIFVIDLENEGEATTFGPGSPATYLNGTVLKQGELVQHYYATGHVSLDNYIAQISGQAPNEETGADCLTPTTSPTTLIGAYDDIVPGTLDPDQARFPGQVDGHGCIYPAFVPTIANQLDALHPPSPVTHRAAWRDYVEDMGNQPTGREIGTSDPTGGLDCAAPALNGADNTNAASKATATAPADQYATRHNGFMYFHSIIDNRAECDANVVPLGSVQVGTPSRLDGRSLADTFSGHLATDLRRGSTTPMFGWITPNLCDDGHDSTCAGPNTIGQSGAGAGGLHGADVFLQHWLPLLEASPAYRSGQMLIVITFDEAGTGDATACCGETPGPDNPTPGFSPLLAPLFGALGLPIPNPAPGGGEVGAVMLDPRYVQPGSVDSTGYYNHYSALRSYEDLLGITSGGQDGLGHLGFASSPGLLPFGSDVFNQSRDVSGSDPGP
jgi:hypothetical protein